MIDFTNRLVIKEHEDLVHRLDGLKTFINEAPEFKDLPPEEQCLLIEQRDAMAQYAMILTRRISILPPESYVIPEVPVTPSSSVLATKDAPVKTEATKK